MKNKALIIALLLSALSLSAFSKVDCSDPKNRPRLVAGMLIGGGKSAIVLIKKIVSAISTQLSAETPLRAK